MRKANQLKIISFAKLHAYCGALIGLLAGVFYSFGGLLVDLMVSLEWVSSADFGTPGLSLGSILAFGALVGMPLMFALPGFVLGLIEALLFNGWVKWVVPIKLDIWK